MAFIYTRSQYIFITTLVVLTILLSQASCRPLIYEEFMQARHEEWMTKYGRIYKDSAEKEMRFMIFKDNVERIEALNKNSTSRGFTLSVNKFADLSDEEFRTLYTSGFKKNHNILETTSFDYANVSAVPSSLDWRKNGAVTPIKDQKFCGCCWAFSVVASLEGINKIKNGKLISLSEQQLVDCDTNDEGCGGGLLETAFDYIKENGGLTSEANYPYIGHGGTCKANKNSSHMEPVAKIKGHKNVPANNEKALLLAVANQPVSIGIAAGSFDFKHYSGGIFTGDCTTKLNHAMSVIGYGVNKDEGEENKYWLLKNSWGTDWGEKGYMKLKRDVADKQGLCGVAIMPSYPVA